MTAALAARDGAGRRFLWAACWLAGFLAWIKAEGLPLAFLLLAAIAVLLRTPPARFEGEAPRLRRVLPPLAAGAAFALVPLALRPLTTLDDVSFFRGDWALRGAERWRQLPELLRRLGADLSAGDSLGLWWLFAAAVLAALVLLLGFRRELHRRQVWTAAALAAVVAAQLAVYAATYVFSYVPWEEHVKTSFFRVASALDPLAALAIAATLAAAEAAQGRASIRKEPSS